MKKFWQIRPWIIFVVLAMVVVGAFIAFKGTDSIRFADNFGSKAVSSAPVAMDIAAPGVSRQSSKEISGGTAVGVNPADRMIIKNGSLTLIVSDVRKSVDDITKYAESKGGFLVTSDISKSDIALYGSLTVRVPAAILDSTIAYVKGMGEVQGEHVDGQDITEQYTDLDAQLKNFQATEQQFLEIMKKAVKIEDVLAVQKELSNVRENIDRIEGQMKYLKESVDLSSLTVYLSTNPSNLPVIDQGNTWKPFAVFKDALRSLVDTGKVVVDSLIWVVAYLPVVIVVLLIAWGVKRYVAKRRKNNG